MLCRSGESLSGAISPSCSLLTQRQTALRVLLSAPAAAAASPAFTVASVVALAAPLFLAPAADENESLSASRTIACDLGGGDNRPIAEQLGAAAGKWLAAMPLERRARAYAEIADEIERSLGSTSRATVGCATIRHPHTRLRCEHA